MCLFNRSEPKPQDPPPAIVGRNPDLVRASQLPDRKELLDTDEDLAEVDYGAGTGEGKKDVRNVAKRQGTDALKINLNTGGEASGSSTGGLNV
tara:strand:+ start:217 stop:495 length:279 start_codon:yes stop_codon:yes gene_type:complete